MSFSDPLKYLAFGAALLTAPFAHADIPEKAHVADVVILGEFHDNPAHHARQAEWITDLSPDAIVWEMLMPAEAETLNDVARNESALRASVETFHWNNIADYIPLMLASDAQFIGAAQPPETVRAAFTDGAAASFGADAQAYGLTMAIPDTQLETRKTLQFDAHCEAMPMEMMGGMVDAQRFRDAAFARAVLRALDDTGPSVVLITGNGHARRDWGVPSYLATVRPELDVFALGQSETGTNLEDVFDMVLSSPPAERGDPCAALR
ncbi:MAG: ChaN family lipoprotein [Pseudomonadota bacterium]